MRARAPAAAAGAAAGGLLLLWWCRLPAERERPRYYNPSLVLGPAARSLLTLRREAAGRSDVVLLWNATAAPAGALDAAPAATADCEDARAFWWPASGGAYCWTCQRPRCCWPQRRVDMCVYCGAPGAVRGGPVRMRDGSVLAPWEKNWIPVATGNGTLHFVYSLRPEHVVLACRWAAGAAGCHVARRLPPSPLLPLQGWGAAAALRGSAAAVRFGPEDALLAAGHLSVGATHGRFRFFLFTLDPATLEVTAASRLFRLLADPRAPHYLHGLAVAGEDEVVLTFGVDDASAWLLRVPAATVRALLRRDPAAPTVLAGAGAPRRII